MSVFLITGTSKGIGHALAEHYLAKGHIVCGCSRGAASIDHSDYHHFTLDVTDEKLVKAMVRSVKKSFGGIDVLINNAGVASMNHTLTTTVDKARQIFDVNFIGTFLFVREVAKIMTRRKNGRIINFSTVAAGLRLEGEAVYAASKAAVANFTQVTAKELGEFNITVNAVAPTPVETDLIRQVPKDKINNLLEQQAIPRIGQFGDVINVVDFFIKEESSFVTGQVIYLGGVHG